MMNEEIIAYEASIALGELEDWVDRMTDRHGEAFARAAMTKLLDRLNDEQG